MTTQRTPELSPHYEPAAIERDIYARWEEAGVFRADAARVLPRVGEERGRGTNGAGERRPPFVIVMPPPNVTAVLHVGHALNNTVQDVLIRWRRMSGDESLWLPGTDHAGIATQNVVEKQLAAEGLTRFDVGRKAFVERVERWVQATGGEILQQLRSIGASCDWTRTAYTLSPELSRAVREAFVRLYERNLIYRGHRVIHWCPRCLTSLSDEEAEHAETSGKLYRIMYPLVDEPSSGIVVATTRPETMLGDVAVAVHPEDDRYRKLVGRRVRLPIAEVEIPIIADAGTDPAFGTGAVKITPAHDANDFDVGIRHGLPMPVVITPTARMEEVTDATGRVPTALRGLDRFEARRRIVAMLEERGNLVRVEDYAHSVRRCYRCDTVVEPRLSDQWFVRMEPLARPALAAVREGRIRILPERWEAVYVNWLENIRDWNISRQLWWGHRIPVWYCDSCDERIVSRDDVAACRRCGGPVRQDEDVLDTWFSSGLWPFSTLGWPDRNAPDLAAFYPTDVLVTAPEILFFWVARMIMLGYEFMGDAPYHTVYLHGTVRDANHQRMSKSRGNGIDPLDVVSLYGADALRYTVIAGLGMGADLILDHKDLERSFAPGRNFTTKLWNIGRFVLTNVGDEPTVPLDQLEDARLARADRWILGRLDAAIRECAQALGPARPEIGPGAPGDGPRWAEEQRRAGLRLNEYAETARRFVWNELADWYLEASKIRLASGGADGETARAVLVHAFDAALRLLHPIVPFVTEALWQRLPSRSPGAWLACAQWPTATSRAGGAARESEWESVRAAITAIRQVRADYGLPPGTAVDAVIVPANGAGGRSDTRATFEDEAGIIGRLTRSRVIVAEAAPAAAAAHMLLPGGTEVIVPLAGIIDVARECDRIKGELGELQQRITGLERRLEDDGFVSRAPASVVEKERQRHRDWLAHREQLSRKVRTLCGG